MSSSENHLHRKVTLWSLGKKWGNKPGESQLNSQFWVLILLSTEQKISAHFSLFSNLDDKVLWRTSCLLLEGTVSENKRVKWEFWGSMGRKLFQDNLNPCTLNRLRMRTMEAKTQKHPVGMTDSVSIACKIERESIQDIYSRTQQTCVRSYFGSFYCKHYIKHILIICPYSQTAKEPIV